MCVLVCVLDCCSKGRYWSVSAPHPGQSGDLCHGPCRFLRETKEGGANGQRLPASRVRQKETCSRDRGPFLQPLQCQCVSFVEYVYIKTCKYCTYCETYNKLLFFLPYYVCTYLLFCMCIGLLVRSTAVCVTSVWQGLITTASGSTHASAPETTGQREREREAPFCVGHTEFALSVAHCTTYTSHTHTHAQKRTHTHTHTHTHTPQVVHGDSVLWPGSVRAPTALHSRSLHRLLLCPGQTPSQLQHPLPLAQLLLQWGTEDVWCRGP